MPTLANLTPSELDKLRARIELARRKSIGDFTYFINNVFSASFDEFVRGDYLDEVGTHFTKSQYTMDVTGRDHFKSTRLYADIMWALFTDEGKGFEAHYFSYNTDLAAYHLKKLKKYVARNIYFAQIKDHKPSSESIIDYSWPHSIEHMTVTPQGLLSGKRGIHAERLYVDDPFKSEEEGSLLEPAQIRKINNVIKSELLPMVKKGGFFRIVGTPQTPSDFFFDSGMQKLFDTWIVAAITDEVNKIALWPEWKPYDVLIALRESLGTVKFNKEYMAIPASSANSYLVKDDLLPLCVALPLKWQTHTDLNDAQVVAGFDIGKKVHPSHLAIFRKYPITNPSTQVTEWRYEQLYSYWMDGWDYLKQVEYLNRAIEMFNISKLYYDNTRGEFEFAMEQRMLNKRYWQPVVLNAKTESKTAAFFGSLVDRKMVTFINEPRQINQLLAVTNDLKAVEGPEGHGDSFWSIAMAIYENRVTSPGVRVI